MRKVIHFLTFLLLLTSCEEENLRPREFATIPEGQFNFGSNKGMESELPEIDCYVNSFQLATTEVSNGQFEVFVDETGYVTDAEKKGGFVFENGWKLVEKANWRMPKGEKLDREKWIDLPVVQISHSDAMTYCEWAGCRLPTEIEWEYASKLGKSDAVRMNIITADSRSAESINVHSYVGNDLNIHHQSGNVWELCADVYNSEIHDILSMAGSNRTFEANQSRSFDFEKVDASDTLRVIKGGSFLCQRGNCAGYRPEARQSVEQSEAYFHIGFRVAKDIK